MPDNLREHIREKYNLGYERGDNPLDGMKHAMRELNNPHTKYRTVHVTGTKGAGSTSDFLAQTLQNAGYKVGKFSGVGMNKGVRDKIRVNGEMIPEDDFLQLAEHITNTITTRDEWDVIVTMAIEWFAQQKIDVAVFEAGVGGRWDSTNAIHAELSVLTNAAVVPEHEHLGNTPAEVAYRKIGIAEPDSTIASNGSKAVNQTVAREAERLNATHVTPTENSPITFERNDTELTYTATYNNQTVQTPITADYLCENANTATKALQASNFTIPDKAVLETLKTFQVPGRAEFLHENPTYVLDGAHNEYATKNAANNLLKRINGRKILIFSAAKERWDGMLQHLTPHVNTTLLTDADETKTAPPEEMVNAVTGNVETHPNPHNALKRAQQLANPDDAILIIGDFTLIAPLRKTLKQKPKQNDPQQTPNDQ